MICYCFDHEISTNKIKYCVLKIIIYKILKYHLCDPKKYISETKLKLLILTLYHYSILQTYSYSTKINILL